MRTLFALLMLAPQQPVDYADAMKKVAAKSAAKAGVVIHIGDSITYANPYSSWARAGEGKTAEEQAVCKWMHVGADDDTDGYFLARVDRPGGRSDTAVSGITSDQYLQGGKAGIPPLADVAKKYNPQIAVVLLGTNDVTGGSSAAQYKANMTRVVDTILANGTIPIVTTIPPYKGKDDVVRAFNAALMELVKEKKIPVIDYCGEILKRRPKDWLGTLISEDGVHPSVGSNAAAAPTEDNLKSSGYLLRSVLSVRKIAEVKARVLDGMKKR